MKERLTLDAAIAAPAITLPWGVGAFEEMAQLGIIVVTLIIVLIRLRIVIREWRSRG